MTISDDVLALAIPSELKTDHPDAALVVQGIMIALRADEDSGAIRAKDRMKAVHSALSSVYGPIFAAHIAKEDEDWGALKSKAQAYDKSEADILLAKLAKLWDEKEDMYQAYRREESSRERRTLVEAMDEVIAEINATEKRLDELGADYPGKAKIDTAPAAPEAPATE